MNRILLIAMGLWSVITIGNSQQVNITGESPNYYLKVNEVFGNEVKVSETLSDQLDHFTPGDKVLIIQMTGALIGTPPDFKTTLSRSINTLGNAGKFEILQLDEVIITAIDTIISFTDNLANSYDNTEKIQLVKVVEGDVVSISGTLTAKSWDGKVGGILAILGIDSVKFANNSKIDVSGKGFRGGAVPDEIYPDNLCRSGISSTVKDTFYFTANEYGRSGNKGEGIITTSWLYTKGGGFNVNGGGAGNGLFAGGGGGSNARVGGDGGNQSAYCVSPYPVIGGLGGFGCSDLYSDPKRPKAILGGGGGSGTRKSGAIPSRGGNGGGMIIIITETLVSGSSDSIKSNGGYATATSSQGSGSGGGGGGTILLDVTSYKGPLFSIQVKGGRGCYTSTPAPNVNGAGGSGSGGVFWHSGTNIPSLSVDTSSTNGGITAGGPAYALQNGLTGFQGAKYKNLIIPLTGFLFNTIKGTDTICASQIPDIITASQPKGGDGIYGYSWQQSIDNSAWLPAVGASTLRSFEPIALTQTTYYRRIVTSSNPVDLSSIHDTSRVIKVFVYPSINNNSITGTDTICYNLDAKPLNGIATPLAGGNGNYQYLWQGTTDNVVWTNRGTFSSFDPSSMIETTRYRRIVNSTLYCSDTSNFVDITVLSSVDNNEFIVADTSICENSSPGRIKLNAPTGGDGDYSYTWQIKSFPGVWANIPFTEDSISYTVGTLSDTTLYRRIVYSGNGNACIDTSNIRTVVVRALISNNFIQGASIQYTCFNAPAFLKGSDPQNGFGPGSFSYAWEESDNNISWNTVDAASHDFESENLTGKRYFRRTVYSSPLLHECTDVSDAVEVRINPLPSGNVINSTDTVCAGSVLYVRFNVSGSGPFNVVVDGTELEEKSLSGIAGTIDSIAFVPLSTQQFTMISIQDDSSCMADVSLFTPVIPCTVYEVPVANAGTDDAVCDKAYTMQAVKTKPGFGGRWSSPFASFENDSLENAVATMSDFGVHVFNWEETNWRCVDDDEVEITFYEQPQLPYAGDDQELDFIFRTQLSATPPSVGNGKWTFSSGAGEFNNDSQKDAIVSELEDDNVLLWTIINGNCPVVSDSLKIIVKPLIITKGFTPNGDGKNDVFTIGSADAQNVENIAIKIFNSAGVLVYESGNYLEGEKFAGLSLSGVDLPEGTYYYTISIKVIGKKKVMQYRSFVEILR